MDRWIAVDFDGTLATRDTEKDPTARQLGEPIWPMVERVKSWLAAGKTVKIFTARLGNAYFTEEEREKLRQWCIKYIGQELPLTNTKDPFMDAIWDDRAVAVVRNTGERVDEMTFKYHTEICERMCNWYGFGWFVQHHPLCNAISWQKKKC